MSESDDLRSLLNMAVSTQDHGAIARLLTQVELIGGRSLALNEILEPKNFSFRLGITGPPGAGKSTLIARLLDRYKHENSRVGIIAVDPTSPFSSGAILGDRVRYTEQSLNSNFFIRSLGSRGSLGGLAAHAFLQARVFDACEFDSTLIETVGVGQLEVEVMNVADAVILVLVPESGDSIQAMKAGVIEIADIIVVNKCDRPGAESLRREIEAQLSLFETEIRPPVLAISAANEIGIDQLMGEILKVRNSPWQKDRCTPARLRAEAYALKRDEIEQLALQNLAKIQTPADLARQFVS